MAPKFIPRNTDPNLQEAQTVDALAKAGTGVASTILAYKQHKLQSLLLDNQIREAQAKMSAMYGTGEPPPMEPGPEVQAEGPGLPVPGELVEGQMPPGVEGPGLPVPGPMQAGPRPMVPGPLVQAKETPEQEISRIGYERYKQLHPTPTYFLNPATGQPMGSVPGRVSPPAPVSQLVTVDEQGNMTPGATLAPGVKPVLGPKPTVPKEDKKDVSASLNDTIREFDNMINEAKAILEDSSLSSATGMSSFLGKIPGTGAKRVSARVETLKAKTLLSLLGSMKQLSKTGASGFGQLSEIEGENIKNSISTLDRNQSTEDFKNSLLRFIAEMETKKQGLQSTFDKTYGGGSVNPATPPIQGADVSIKGKKINVTGFTVTP